MRKVVPDCAVSIQSSNLGNTMTTRFMSLGVSRGMSWSSKALPMEWHASLGMRRKVSELS